MFLLLIFGILAQGERETSRLRGWRLNFRLGGGAMKSGGTCVRGNRILRCSRENQSRARKEATVLSRFPIRSLPNGRGSDGECDCPARGLLPPAVCWYPPSIRMKG